jgi:hypothetical protein
MSFDKETRNLLAKTVTACRRRLIEDVTDQLRGVFGLHPDGTVLPLDKLTHLSPDQNSAARHLRDLLDHYTVGTAGKDSDRRKAAYERMVLEISFTVLNRLAALRLCEERGLVVECVRKSMSSDGFQMFERISGGALGPRYDTYRVFLECLFDELALDLGVLFDRMTPQSALFPTERCMVDILAELNKPELTHLWTEDETIGWIYQYFNPPEERKAMREASQAPRNSRELAVRNQFFTPRYVVEFLTDNTLGRIWYEMRKGQTVLKEECRYLVRRPNEIFLAPGEKAPIEPESETDLPREELLRKPVRIEHRPKKDPRHLRLLDPAGGSGHFLLYAFDLLERIYEEAWVDPDLGPELWAALDFTPVVDESASDEVVDPKSVYRRREAEPHCFSCGGPAVLFILADLYKSVWTAGRPMTYCDECEAKIHDSIRLAIPLQSFSYSEAVKSGWFANSTGTIFLGLAKSFDYRMGGPREGMFEKLEHAAQDENMLRLRLAAPKLIIEQNLHGIDIDPRAVQIAALALWLRAQKSWKNLGIKAAERPRIAKSNIVTAEPMPGEEDMRREFTSEIKPRVLGQLMDVVFEKMKLAGEAGSLLKIEEEIKDAVAAAGKQWREGPKPEQQLLFPTMDAPRPTQLELRFNVKGVTDERFWDQAEDRILDALKDYAEQAENGLAGRRRLFADDAARGFAFIDLCRKRYDVVLMNPPFGESASATKEYLGTAFSASKYDLFAMFVIRWLERLNIAGRLGAITNKTGFFLQTFATWREIISSGGSNLETALDLGFGVLDSAMVETMSYVLSKEGNQSTNGTVFIRLANVTEKASALYNYLDTLKSGRHLTNVWLRQTSEFKAIPNSPMCYWAGKGFVDLFLNYHPFAPNSGHIYQGIATGDNFRFLRCRWEISPDVIASKEWVTYAKGGVSTLWYSDFPLVVFWANDGSEIKANAQQCYGSASRTVKNEIVFFKAGVTYTQVTVKGFFARVLPAGCVFDMKGPSVILEGEKHLVGLGVFCSTPIRTIAKLLTDCRQWHPTNMMCIPYPTIQASKIDVLQSAVSHLIAARRDRLTADEISSCYSFGRTVHASESESALSSSVDEIVAKGFGSQVSDFVELDSILKAEQDDDGSEDDSTEQSEISDDNYSVMSRMMGFLFGRWDIRIAIDPALAPKLPDPFDPLPVCPPVMLVGTDGLPAEPNRIVSEEWLRTRPDANTLPPEGSIKNPSVSDEGYPLRISWDSILVDDPGFNGAQPHRDDILRRVREVFDLLWKDKAHEIEQEACDILGVSDLRDYFRKPTGFFQDHLKRYSKSRRKAPIYWPLSTASGSYTIWLYYHRLTDQTLYAMVNKYLEPKIAEVERGIAQTESDMKATSGRDATRLTDNLNEARTFLGELRDLREELLRIAALPFNPDLNDGVIINAAPFHRLFRLRSWAKDTEDCWKKLQKGDYDWAHLAYTIWPDRVREACKTDRSIAIAHGLEDLCEVETPVGKKTGKRRKKS